MKEKLFFAISILFLILSICFSNFADSCFCFFVSVLFFYFSIDFVKNLFLKKSEKHFYVKNKKTYISNKDVMNLKLQVTQLAKERDKLLEQISLIEKQDIFKSIKELERKKAILDTEVSSLEKSKFTLSNEIEQLKTSKGVLLENIDSLKSEEKTLSKVVNNSKFSIDYIDSLSDGFEFEKYFALLLEKLGYYDIEITSGSGDFGIDVLAKNDDILYGFQCKLYSSPVGNKAIQETFSGKTHYNCNVGIVVTNNYFTEQAKEQAKDTNIILWDRNTLSRKLEDANSYDFKITF